MAHTGALSRAMDYMTCQLLTVTDDDTIQAADTDICSWQTEQTYETTKERPETTNEGAG